MIQWVLFLILNIQYCLQRSKNYGDFDIKEKTIVQNIRLLEQGSRYFNEEIIRNNQERSTRIITIFALASAFIVLGTILSVPKEIVFNLDHGIFSGTIFEILVGIALATGIWIITRNRFCHYLDKISKQISKKNRSP
jgi:hypothetical protein